ncbi:MAG: hypothetical protein HDR49_01450 [Bacteroides sp.]|nr:hypothetical protein [Bacteroides sp.]
MPENKTNTIDLRRNLSGIFIFDTLPQDNGKRKPTCIEDAKEPVRIKWLYSLDRSKLTRTANYLTDIFRTYIYDEEKAQFNGLLDGEFRCKIVSDRTEQIDIINRFCMLSHKVAHIFSIAAEGSEAALAESELDHDQSINK